jgi:flagellar assembly protein FliH
LIETKTEEQKLLGKIASLEANLTEVKNASLQKERELAAGVEAAKEQARAEGRTQGHAEGLKSGHEEGLTKASAEVEEQYREKFSNLVSTLEGVSAKLEENFAELVSLNQPRMLRLWQEMLKKMLQRETSLEPDGIFDVLKDILSRLSDKNHILIYVAPQDLELLQDRLGEKFEDVLRGVKHLELKPDTSVDKGSCIVETNLGVYDARWRTQLSQIEATLESLFQKLGKASKQKPDDR